jgi:hypothetical protein
LLYAARIDNAPTSARPRDPALIRQSFMRGLGTAATAIWTGEATGTTAGLDSVIHHFTKEMDVRIKPTLTADGRCSHYGGES